ncbi:saccharopine dehydrogenase [Oceanicola sp. 22II-s10i]|uniref:saccharopine dehydrogenase family protein n=1 Tax=Oceanicola sp. 22II-s10i TaxID=1317116 RepID=UPI000B51E868|nr:saccharopine dehydrogenase family protein [Oceanicola sp. 22II-s10i]OWU86132.1 saccharopine dehydrogenase [Oceanicola sp. 22II-s10i]
MTIHWCGTGLSAIPGLRRLIGLGYPVTIWNRTVARAQEEVGDLTDDIRAFDMAALDAAVAPGDVVISMLPGDWHPKLAALCVDKGAHFVTSSYIAPETRALDGAARDKGLSFVNEVGLDPGIDHLMAHHLVADYRASDAFDPANEISFTSYCGGFPKIANDFRYKFSWSPLGVLKALRSPSKSLKDFETLNVDRPWNAITRFTSPLPGEETFEAYPNRDSFPFIEDYRFDPDWKVRTFVRGTLRLDGWARAWDPIFREIETLTGPEGEARLTEMSDQFWRDHAYDEGEPDRVVLFVSLKAEKDGKTVWHKTYAMDAWGDDEASAMGRLVSVPVSLAVEAVLAGRLPEGVTPAPHDPQIVEEWLDEIGQIAQRIDLVDHVG